MSWLSSGVKKLGKGAKKLVTDPKKWAENAGRSVGTAAQAAAPFLPPGFRQAASIGGSIAAGNNMEGHLKSAIGAEIGSAMGGRGIGQSIGRGAGQVMRGGIRALPAAVAGIGRGNLPSPTSTFPGTGPRPLGFNNPVTFPGSSGAPGGDGGIDWGSILGSALNFGKENAADIGLGGMAAWQAAASAKASKRAGELSDKGLAHAENRWASQAPLRGRGIQQALNPTKADLSDVYHDPTNPFAVKRALPRAAAPVAAPSPLPPPNRMPYPVPRNPAQGATPVVLGRRPLLPSTRRLTTTRKV